MADGHPEFEACPGGQLFLRNLFPLHSAACGLNIEGLGCNFRCEEHSYQDSLRSWRREKMRWERLSCLVTIKIKSFIWTRRFIEQK